jgi:D-xylose transport system ATP-binding protein
MEDDNRLLLRAEELTKSFGGVRALRGVSFDLRAGEIHALCGENGAGKSTLIKVLSGIHPHGSYEGRVRVDGREVVFSGVRDSAAAGIAVITQELALVDEMSVAENIFLAAPPLRAGGLLVDWARMRREAAELLGKFGVDLDPSAIVGRLGIGQKQLVEIVKALAMDSRVLILDEPTAALAEHEVRVLLRILRDLRARGLACILISHKLEEVFAVADRVTVLRDGATVATSDAGATNSEEVVRQMVGRELTELFPERSGEPGGVLLEVDDLSVRGEGGARHLDGVSLRLRAGEVLGLGGLMGAGRTELLTHLFGCWGSRVAGRVRLLGRDTGGAGPGELLRRGMALVSEDRRRHGLVLDRSIGFNLSLASLAAISGRAGLVDGRREFKRNEAMARTLRVKAGGQSAPVATLSGGNQQKVVLGKVLLADPRVILLDEPTRGIDIGAKAEIYQIIRQLTAEGRAVLLVSSELPELIGMSDRILMLREGAVAGEFPGGTVTQEELLAAAMPA